MHQNSVCVHVFVSGRVQGVGYRAATADLANLLKLKGWVRNLRDGRVEAVFVGEPDRIEEMLHWCEQGPPAAVVDRVEVEVETVQQFSGFEVQRTV